MSKAKSESGLEPLITRVQLQQASECPAKFQETNI
jgi:hypothetical protein